MWRQFTTLESEKQGPAIVLTLEGEALDAALEIETSVVRKPYGTDRIITRLIKIYKKDDLLEGSERQYHETKSYVTTIANDVLAYRLVKAANLPS